MNPNLYADPNMILSRTPSSRNVWLGTLSSSIAVILSKYVVEFKETGENKRIIGYRDVENIDKFLDYIKEYGKIRKGFGFYTNKEKEINETISLLSKDNDISKIEEIITDLTEVLSNVKNKIIKEPRMLIFYSHLFDSLSDIALTNPENHPSCKNLDCDVCGDN